MCIIIIIIIINCIVIMVFPNVPKVHHSTSTSINNNTIYNLILIWTYHVFGLPNVDPSLYVSPKWQVLCSSQVSLE